jgi:AraC-type DNA-binding domain-containing proteins
MTDIITQMFSFIDKQSNSYNANMIESLKKYICENLDKILSLDSLADIVHLNPKYLSRLFKDISGENITDYINQRRMEKACELLQSTKMTVEDIGIAVGFNNYPYFIRRFKETYGYTPKIYQTMLLKQADFNKGAQEVN